MNKSSYRSKSNSPKSNKRSRAQTGARVTKAETEQKNKNSNRCKGN